MNKIPSYWSAGAIIGIIGLALTGLKTANGLENQVNENELNITYQQKMQQAQNEHTQKKLDELSADAKEIKKLINQLLLK